MGSECFEISLDAGPGTRIGARDRHSFCRNWERLNHLLLAFHNRTVKHKKTPTAETDGERQACASGSYLPSPVRTGSGSEGWQPFPAALSARRAPLATFSKWY